MRGGVEAVLITERLSRRRVRAPDRRERRAFAALSRDLTRDPGQAPQKLVNVALDLCAAGSAGISVLHRESSDDYLCWSSVAGRFAPHTNVITPRNFSPCGTALEAKQAQLFYCPGRFFTYLDGLCTPVVELLVAPIHADGQALGTIWVASHDTPVASRAADARQFDAGDLRITVGLAELAATALQQAAFKPRHPKLRWPLAVGIAAAAWGRRLASTLRSISH